MSVSINTTYFPKVNKYLAEMQIDSTGSIGGVRIWVQVRGINSTYDWYVNNGGWCYARLYIDGAETAVWDLATWGAQGSGLNGVQYSEWQWVDRTVSKNSTLRLTIDCSLGPKIGKSKTPMGFLDTGTFTPNWSSVVKFTVPPTVTSVYNNNKYNNNSGISASTDSISIGLNTGGDAPTSWQYEWPYATEQWHIMPSNPFTVPGLSAGTTYHTRVWVGNEAGGNYGYIAIRTRHNKPSLTLPEDLGTITDTVRIPWSSNKPCQQVAYRLRNISSLGDNYSWDAGWGSWVYSNLYYNESSGVIMIYDLVPGDAYEIQVSVLSTANYDSLWSDNVSIGFESIQPAFLVDPVKFIFGENFEGYINNPSGKANIITFREATTMQYLFEKEIPATGIKNQGDKKFSYEVSQDIWDILYKALPGTSNSTTILVTVGTVTETEVLNMSYIVILTLTGKMKTMKVYSENKLERVQGWVQEQNTLTECVAWIGMDGKAVRVI